MAAGDDGKGKDRRPVPAGNVPARRDDTERENDHRGAQQERYAEGGPEAGEDARDLLPEVGALDLLLGRAPGDVVREQVREERRREVDGEAAEEKEAVAGA